LIDASCEDIENNIKKILSHATFGKFFEFYWLFSFNFQIQPVLQARSPVISSIYYSKSKFYKLIHQFFADVSELQPFFWPIPLANFELAAGSSQTLEHGRSFPEDSVLQKTSPSFKD